MTNLYLSIDKVIFSVYVHVSQMVLDQLGIRRTGCRPNGNKPMLLALFLTNKGKNDRPCSKPLARDRSIGNKMQPHIGIDGPVIIR